MDAEFSRVQQQAGISVRGSNPAGDERQLAIETARRIVAHEVNFDRGTVALARHFLRLASIPE